MTIALLILIGGLLVFAILPAARSFEASIWRESLIAIDLHIPYGLTPDDVARWLNTVAAATHPSRMALIGRPPIALETVADAAGVRHFLLVSKGMRETILSGLRAALPGVRLTEQPEYLATRVAAGMGVEATLTNPQRQLSVQRAEGTATAILATLQPLADDEAVVVQWLLTSAGTPAPVHPTATQQAVPGWHLGQDRKDDDAVRSERLKLTDSLLHASLRVAVRASDSQRAYAVLGRVFGQHQGQNSPGAMFTRRWWLPMTSAADRLHRLIVPITWWPLRMSTREIAGLLPIPVGEVALPGVALGMARQLPPPPGMPTTGVKIGISNYPDMQTPLFLADVDRLQHLHVLGPTGVGKSTLLANLICQDIAAGHGVVVIDPKSDLVTAILERIPDHRADDVIVMDAASAEHPVGFNIMSSAHDEQGRELVVDNVIHIWHEIYKDFWGPRSEDVLRGALLSLVNSNGANGEPFTLIETPEILVRTDFRKFVTGQDGVPAGLESFGIGTAACDPTSG